MAPSEIPQFHIGVKTKKKLKYKRKPKVNKQSNYNMVSPSLPFTKWREHFKVYNGPRWFIPSGIKVSKSVRDKFDMLSACPREEVFMKIRNYSIYSMFNIQGFPNGFNIHANWNPPLRIRSMLYSIRDKHKNEWLKVAYIYRKIFHFNNMFNRIISSMKVKACIKNVMNVDDPVTMEVPRKPVYVLNFKRRCSYVYDANSLKRAMENRLLNSNWMFLEVKEPVNILSNEEFTLYQYVSIYMQLREHRQFSYILERFRHARFDISVFEKYNKQYLKLMSIEHHFRDEVDNSRSTVIDFMKVMCVGRGVDDRKFAKCIGRYDYKNPDEYIREWIFLTKKYYIAKEVSDLIVLDEIYEETRILASRMNTIY